MFRTPAQIEEEAEKLYQNLTRQLSMYGKLELPRVFESSEACHLVADRLRNEGYEVELKDEPPSMCRIFTVF